MRPFSVEITLTYQFTTPQNDTSSQKKFGCALDKLFVKGSQEVGRAWPSFVDVCAPQKAKQVDLPSSRPASALHLIINKNTILEITTTPIEKLWFLFQTWNYYRQ